MCRSLNFGKLIFRLVVSAVAYGFMSVRTVESAVDETPSPSRAIYHSDREHLWNRLHEALFVRGAFGQDRLEPLLWAYSKHLLEERSHKRLMEVLEEFLKNNGETLIDDPLKRAVLQRDLWLVFNWLERDRHPNDFAEPKLTKEETSAAQVRLRGPLAEVIGWLELGPQEIRELPDNYAAAVASGQFAKSFDIRNRDQPYLPPDLFATNGPWVCVGRDDGRTAPQHLRGENPFTNSVFLVFIRLPAERAAVADYLRDRPPFPKGTELALVRQAMLIDTSHRVVASRLTESVQFRVIGDARDKEASFEFRLSRSQLFAGRAGGLRLSSKDDRDFKTGFLAHNTDEFEYSVATGNLPSSQMQPMLRCSVCHTARFPELRSGEEGMGQKVYLTERLVPEVAAAAIKWREAQPNWSALRKLLAE